ncbi:MAG: formate/nitrite transporter family protein [Pseudomonadota bacterium]
MASKQKDHDQEGHPLPETQVDIYEIIEREGREGMARPTSSLFWAGIAAGFGISLSVFCEAFLRQYLPDAPWRPLVENFGYTVGFLLVILGRMHLFTEETVTAVLPVLRDQTREALWKISRLWTIVFLANITGTALVALLVIYGGILNSGALEAAYEISIHFAGLAGWNAFLYAIPAGFIIASLVWISPQAGNAAPLLIIIFTYMIALGDMSHVVAGSTEIWLLLFSGQLSVYTGIMQLLIPALIGNIIGGTGLVAIMAYAQVKSELDEDD